MCIRDRLNDGQVRAGLEARGIHVPDDTWFVPAVHNTTTDEIRLLDIATLPATHASEFAQLQKWIQEAGRLCRTAVSYTHLRAHETVLDLVCRLLLEKKKNNNNTDVIDT